MGDYKNEYIFKVGEQEYTARATFNALYAIEKRTGKGVLQLMEEVAQMRAGIGDVHIILDETLKAGGNKLGDKAVGDYIMEVGLGSVMGRVAEILKVGLTGVGKPTVETPTAESA